MENIKQKNISLFVVNCDLSIRATNISYKIMCICLSYTIYK